MIQHKGVTWWLEIVKIARKGFEVVSNGEGQAMALQPKNLARVKKKVHAFSWGINQAITVTLKCGIKYIGYIIESDLIHLKLTHIYWMESSHMLRMAMLKKKIKIDMLTLSLDEDWELWDLTLKKINSRGSNFFFIWSWVNRYVVLLRGMHHVDRWLLISAQDNPCEVWVVERHECKLTLL